MEVHLSYHCACGWTSRLFCAAMAGSHGDIELCIGHFFGYYSASSWNT